MTTKINVIDKDFVVNELKIMFEKDIKQNIFWRIKWKTIGEACIILSKLSMGVCVISEFIASFWTMKSMSFVAGCSSTVAILLLSYSSYSFDKSIRTNNELDKLLNKLNLKVVGIQHENSKELRQSEQGLGSPNRLSVLSSVDKKNNELHIDIEDELDDKEIELPKLK